MNGLFVTGTDTGVGKTMVCAWLMAHWPVDYWKPVQSGLDGETDTATVRRLSGCPAERFHAETFSLHAPLSPHESSRLEGVHIALTDFVIPSGRRPILAEGAGGVLVPLNERDLMIDLMARLGWPVLLVARTALGTINHTLLSLQALRGRGLTVSGVVLSGAPNPVNRRAIEHYGQVTVLGELAPLATLTPEGLSAQAPPTWPGPEIA